MRVYVLQLVERSPILKVSHLEYLQNIVTLRSLEAHRHACRMRQSMQIEQDLVARLAAQSATKQIRIKEAAAQLAEDLAELPARSSWPECGRRGAQ